jgi:hypothetical protein
MAECETIAATYRFDCWFYDPHSPWQRGQIENDNRNRAGGSHEAAGSTTSPRPEPARQPTSSTADAAAPSPTTARQLSAAASTVH